MAVLDGNKLLHQERPDDEFDETDVTG
jgi:hypothetical protein